MRPPRIVWTPAMDKAVLGLALRDASAKLGLPVSSIASRRRTLGARGVFPARTNKMGRPRGITTGPGPVAALTIYLFGLGYPRATIVGWRGVTRQAVDDLLKRYVFAKPGRPRYCCICLGAFKPKAADVVTCSRECEKQYKANRAGA